MFNRENTPRSIKKMSYKSVLFVSICLLSIVIFVDGVPVNLHRYGSEGIAKIVQYLKFMYF